MLKFSTPRPLIPKLLWRITGSVVVIGVLSLAACTYQQAQDSSAPIALDTPIDTLIVSKAQREMSVYSQGKLIKTYQIALGFEPVGHKQFEGDGKTPEGWYTINDRNPNSQFYKNLGVSYPNQADKDYAAAHGKSAGGDIKIHGLPNNKPNVGALHRWMDWTEGCIAVTNEEMEELYSTVQPNAKILIQP